MSDEETAVNADALLAILEDEAPVTNDKVVQTHVVELEALAGEAFGSRCKRAMELIFDITLLASEFRVTWNKGFVTVRSPCETNLQMSRTILYQDCPPAITVERFALVSYVPDEWMEFKAQKRRKLHFGSVRDLLRYGAMGPAIVELMERTLTQTQERLEATQHTIEEVERLQAALANRPAWTPPPEPIAVPETAIDATRRRLRNIRIRRPDDERDQDTD